MNPNDAEKHPVQPYAPPTSHLQNPAAGPERFRRIVRKTIVIVGAIGLALFAALVAAFLFGWLFLGC